MTYKTMSAGEEQEDSRSSRAAKEVEAFADDCARDFGEVVGLDVLTHDRLALLRLSRSELARVHELTIELIGERFDNAAA